MRGDIFLYIFSHLFCDIRCRMANFACCMAQISVIVPFHNVEHTVERTLRSMAAQTMTDFELVLVNDGSTDRSLEVVKAFLELTPSLARRSIIVSYPYRQGLARANDQGLHHATGEYLARCDADDEMPPDALRRMLEATDGGRVDVVGGAYTVVKSCGREHTHQPPFGVKTLEEMPIDTLHFALWNKLIRRRLLVDNEIWPFPDINCWEDVAIVARLFALHPTVAWVKEPCYIYYDLGAGSSLSNGRQEMRLRDHLKCALALEDWFVTHHLADANEQFLLYLKFVAKVKYLRGPGKDVEKWHATFPEANNRILSYKHIPLGLRLAFWTVKKLPTRLTQWVADRFDRFYPSTERE